MLGGYSPAPVPTPPRSGNKQPFCEPRKPKFDCWKRSKSPKGSARYPDLPSMVLGRGYTFEGTPLTVRCRVRLAETYPAPPLPAAASCFPSSRRRTAPPALGGPICGHRARKKGGLSSWEPKVHPPACSLSALGREQEEKLASSGAKSSPESRKWYKLSQHSLSKLDWGYVYWEGRGCLSRITVSPGHSQQNFPLCVPIAQQARTGTEWMGLSTS